MGASTFVHDVVFLHSPCWVSVFFVRACDIDFMRYFWCLAAFLWSHFALPCYFFGRLSIVGSLIFQVRPLGALLFFVILTCGVLSYPLKCKKTGPYSRLVFECALPFGSRSNQNVCRIPLSTSLFSSLYGVHRTVGPLSAGGVGLVSGVPLPPFFFFSFGSELNL